MKVDEAPPQLIFVSRGDMTINTAREGIGRMRRLKPLSPGAKIKIISPASWLETEKLVSAEEVLRASGFRVEISAQSFLRKGSFAGSDEERAQAINRAFADPDVSAIICARGGYGCPRAYNYLDFDLIRANPKIFVGYSDITPLLNYIPQALGFPTFHGPMAIDFSGDHKEQTADTLVGVLSGIERTICNYKPITDDVIREGECFGALYGGNITMLSTSGGTAMFPKTENSILLIEDVSELLYKLDRYLNQFKQAGLFDSLSGLVIGKMVNRQEGARPFGKTEREIYSEYFCDERKSYPVIMCAPFGHAPEKRIVPIGWPLSVRVTFNQVLIQMPESPFCPPVSIHERS